MCKLVVCTALQMATNLGMYLGALSMRLLRLDCKVAGRQVQYLWSVMIEMLLQAKRSCWTMYGERACKRARQVVSHSRSAPHTFLVMPSACARSLCARAKSLTSSCLASLLLTPQVRLLQFLLLLLLLPCHIMEPPVLCFRRC